MERFVIIVNGFQPLTLITKGFIMDVAAVLDPPLMFQHNKSSTDILNELMLANLVLLLSN